MLNSLANSQSVAIEKQQDQICIHKDQLTNIIKDRYQGYETRGEKQVKRQEVQREEEEGKAKKAVKKTEWAGMTFDEMWRLSWKEQSRDYYQSSASWL